MAARDVKAGAAYVEIYVKDQLDMQLRAAGNKLQAFGQSIAFIGATLTAASAAVTAPLTATTAVFASYGDELSKAADRTGITASALSELRYAAEQSGASFSDLQNGLKGMSKFTQQVVQGSAAATDALDKMGISATEFLQASPEDRLGLLADGLNRIEDPSLRASYAMATLGKGGVALLPMLKEGSQGIDALSARARDLGLTVSDLDASNATKFGDLLADFAAIAKSIAFNIGAALAGPLLDFLEWAVQTAGEINKFIQANRGFVVSITVAASIVGAIGSALIVLGVSISTVGFALAGLTSGIAAIGTIIGFVGSALAALATPVGMLIIGLVAFTGAIAIMGYTFISQTEIFKTGVAILTNLFGQLYQVASTTFVGIGEAIASGQWSKAMEIAGLGLNAAWQRIIGLLRVGWAGFVDYFVNALLDGVRFAAKQIDNIAGTTLAQSQLLAPSTGQADAQKAVDANIATADAALAVALAQMREVAAQQQQVVEQATKNTEMQARAMQPSAEQGGAAGTFSSAVAGLLGSSGKPLDKLARNSDKTNSLLEELINTVDSQAQPEFG